MRQQGNKCRICNDEFGVGVHFGTSFICRDCEDQFWDFMRAALRAVKEKKKASK